MFPSLTDTFGLVLLEALASGVPVAAYPASGPRDVLTDPRVGVLSSDLREAALRALRLDRGAAREHALLYSWENSARQFMDNMLIAHNMGLPDKRALFRRWRQKRTEQKKQKKTARLGGEPSRLILMRQFGGRFGGYRVSAKMVSGLTGVKRGRAKSPRSFSKD